MINEMIPKKRVRVGNTCYKLRMSDYYKYYQLYLRPKGLIKDGIYAKNLRVKDYFNDIIREYTDFMWELILDGHVIGLPDRTGAIGIKITSTDELFYEYKDIRATIQNYKKGIKEPVIRKGVRKLPYHFRIFWWPNFDQKRHHFANMTFRISTRKKNEFVAKLNAGDVDMFKYE